MTDDDARALLRAARAGSIDEVKELLATAAGVDIDVRDEDGCTPLHLALSEGFAELAALLVENGADPNLVDDSAFTIVHWSVFGGSASLVGWASDLVGGGLDARDREGRTPLSWAISEANLPAIELLLSRGASPDIVDADGWGPLHFAAARNNVRAIEMLLAAGAGADVRSTRNETPLDVATRLAQHAAAAVLARGTPSR